MFNKLKLFSDCIENIEKQIKLLEYNIKKLGNNRYVNGYVFFIPLISKENRYPYLKGNIQHIGVVINNYSYETFNYELHSVLPEKPRISELINKYNATLIPVKNIDTFKIYDNIFSGTCCDEFVARAIGLSSGKGTDKGKYFPEDIYNILYKNKTS